MNRFSLVSIALCILFSSCGTRSFSEHVSLESLTTASVPTQHSLQAVVVTVKDWNSVQGTLGRFERETATSEWKNVGQTFSIVVGKKGIAWGRGLHRTPPHSSEPVKKEGDGRAPAGVFPIKLNFGYADELKTSPSSLPYLKLLQTTECVDDPKSKYYNNVVDKNKVTVDWTSSEKMRFEPLYKWGAWIGHNTNGVVKSAGSCIFFHIWSGTDKGTAGCTAMEEKDLLDMLSWFETQSRPLLIQLPEGHYNELKSSWQLP